MAPEPRNVPRRTRKLLLVTIAVVLLSPKIVAELSYLTLVSPGGDTNSDLRALRTLGALSYFGRAPLIRLLHHPHVVRRAQAADSLSHHSGRAVVDALVEAARDDESGVRNEALRSLGRIGDPRAIPAMEELARVSGYAEEPLTWMGPKGRDALIRVVDDEGTEPAFRGGALYYLCRSEHRASREVGEAIERGLASRPPVLRTRAARCLSDSDATPAARLEALLADAEPGVRIVAASGLLSRGNRTGHDVLRRIIEDRSMDEDQRSRAIKELGKFEEPGDVALLHQLRDQDASAIVRRAAQVALQVLFYAGVDVSRSRARH